MAEFYTLLTQTGQAKMANAIALGTTIEITHLAVGDGGGVMPVPDSDRETLVNERRRAQINRVEVDSENPNWLIVEQVLPPDIGGWTIREVGIFDSVGDLIGYGNYPETYKPTLDEGSGRTLTIRMVLEVSHTSNITLRVDPSVVLATREYADKGDQANRQALEEHKAGGDHDGRYASADQGGKADSAIQSGDLAPVAFSGLYSALSGKPPLGSAAATESNQYATAEQGGKADSALQSADLAPVAFSGAYSHLTGRPSLGTAAGKDVQGDATDGTAGRLMAVGAGGLLAGTNISPPAITSFNANLANGFYAVNVANLPGSPEAEGAEIPSLGSLIQSNRLGIRKSQLYLASTGNILYRVEDGEGYGPWRKMHHTGNLAEMFPGGAGWRQIPGTPRPFIEQWVNVVIPPNAISVSGNWPINFPNGPFAPSVLRSSSPGGVKINNVVGIDMNASGFTLSAQDTDTGNRSFYIRVLGS